MAATEIDIDEADVLVLSQSLEKVSELTFQIKKSLNRIGVTTDQSSKLFSPILSRNNMLATMQRNIESTLNSVSSVKDLANEASKHEIVLQKGIKEVGLKPYIKAIHKLDDMLDDIKSNNSNQEKNAEFTGILTHLAELIKSSEGSLKIYFIGILNMIKPFDPQIYMNKKMPFPYFEDEHLLELSIILDYFNNSSENSNIQDIFIQERTEMILKCMAFLEPFAKQVTTSENAPYEKGSSGILGYTEALLGFISNEQSLVDDLYVQQPDFKPHILSSIVKPLLNAYVRLFNINISMIKNNLENAGVFSFELIDSINEVKRSLRGNTLKNYEPIEECYRVVSKLTQEPFRNSIQRIISKTKNITTIPSDNGVTEATVDTMSRLRKFSEYKSGCLSAIATMKRENWLPPDYVEKEFTLKGKLVNNDPASLFSCFLSDCIDTLIVSIERSAQRILIPNIEPDVANPNSSRNTQKPRIGFFIIMNLVLIEQIVEKSGLNSLLGSDGHTRLEKLKKRYINYLVSDWKDLTANLLDSVFVDSSGKIASKDKDQIKEKFRRFNEGFEELVSKFKHYRLSDPALKSLLKSEIIALVMPMYERFYGRYKDSFKNPRKHIKYTPSELTSVLNQLGR
ncbi:hypothetical protein Kpol_463p2 [Vanderwaltozyma polyspora DSM 70294]|uniref:Exocyst complex protein EXO70 n=1 Tax=Vanderwaltozyma polyspora (strain ATCC 22028 / DSM 70294 / BCRC 21397 / CBS 2163 / NBRC 10782 / NRRL Y-8283 / UCD 57-17) TaxID=436907 RepID=A7TQI9_VANPO|nr:uncharacterized protein Kpol_463p2 [Vanderwaltozyma polyspora DSM 70294]EDO15453.1 hypothetical protein Kpol_463p2 [Vanderwaltozyma polyspora DSM 70294]